ncbi:hypothetical protein BGZ95_006727 [Linnemannia exigua]|uniref:Uncharacterized protein n=1 Tax=Linnemannia exigua TaxID=604196 RepID=A0AAD4D0Q9_9FUNG|nr:hypothetical protein BGZ95_006727 [Linnemannia exigua]
MMTTVPSPILSPRYEPTLEELETMVYSNPLDFNPEEFVPLQLGEDDFLPIFEDISFRDGRILGYRTATIKSASIQRLLSDNDRAQSDSASCLFEYMYDAAGHTALPQTMQQQDSLPIPVLTSSSHPNPNLNGLPVQFSSYLGSTIEFEMASASTPAPAYIPIVSTPVLARNTKHYIDLLATKKPATFQP